MIFKKSVREKNAFVYFKIDTHYERLAIQNLEI